MKVMIDTNVLLDVLGCRSDFEDSLTVFRLCETRMIEGHISALSATNIAYILRKQLSKEETKKTLKSLNSIFVIDDLKGDDIITAANMDYADYEDELQMIDAKRIEAEYLITRDKKHFENSDIPVVTPRDFVQKYCQFVA